ncbi:hypothetical protein Mapa_017383 [Marchantia paleacea]|nr:hypothetical protein Mapa_017383 [Marchantia paleacea]
MGNFLCVKAVPLVLLEFAEISPCADRDIGGLRSPNLATLDATVREAMEISVPLELELARSREARLLEIIIWLLLLLRGFIEVDPCWWLTGSLSTDR